MSEVGALPFVGSLAKQSKLNNYLILIKIRIKQLNQVTVLHFNGNIKPLLKVILAITKYFRHIASRTNITYAFNDFQNFNFDIHF